MLVTLISVVVLAAGIVGAVLYEKDVHDSDTLYGCSVVALLIGALATLFAVGLCVSSVIRPEVQYNADLIEFETLQAQVDNGADTTNLLCLTNEVTEYNQMVLNYKEFADSPWVGWFYYDGCEDLPYVIVPNGFCGVK